MKQVKYTDEDGKNFLVQLPDNAKDEDAYMGVVIGPPDISNALDWPNDLSIRLHNMLFDKKLFTSNDIRRNPGVLQGIIASVLKADVSKVYEAYISLEK